MLKPTQFIATMPVLIALAFTATAPAKTPLPPGAVKATVTKVKVKTKTKTFEDEHGHKKRVKVTTRTTYYTCDPGYKLNKKYLYCTPPKAPAATSTPEGPSTSASAPTDTPTDPTINVTVIVEPPAPVISDAPNNDVCGSVLIVDLETGEDMSPCAPTNPRTKICQPGEEDPLSKLPLCAELFPFLNVPPSDGGMKKGSLD